MGQCTNYTILRIMLMFMVIPFDYNDVLKNYEHYPLVLSPAIMTEKDSHIRCNRFTINMKKKYQYNFEEIGSNKNCFHEEVEKSSIDSCSSSVRIQ